MTLSPQRLVALGLGVLAVVLLTDTIRFFGRHTVTYVFESGALSTDPAFIWTGPFTYAGIGTQEEWPIRRELPNLYLHLRGEAPVAMRSYTEDAFAKRHGETDRPRYNGYAYGHVGDARLGFAKGKLVRVDLWHDQGARNHQGPRPPVGWPCLSKGPDTTRFCLPISRSAAEELFGEPTERKSQGVPWI